jgi:hypothetical protein
MPSIDLQGIATFIGLLLTGIGLIYAGFQLRDSKRIARGDFLLRLDEALRHHDNVHKRLRPGGSWSPLESSSSSSGSGSSSSAIGPSSYDEWVEVESYMGLFERIKVLVDDKIIDIGTIDRLYGYRVFNIVANDTIHKEKLVKRPDGWQDFIGLWHALERHREKRATKERT